ncbi:M1 family metallopeptidase [Flavobacteriaceae bacterium]|nr:M1 family metallopeptidase [Flavobacteriaceae bacterium]
MDPKNNTTRQDTLRGSITLERSWWDLNYYHLDISVNPEKKYIEGSNLVYYTVLNSNNVLQIDLQEPLELLMAKQEGEELEIQKEGNAYFITLKKDQIVGSLEKINLFYKGNPREAVNAPWDGGISWEKDDNGNHFIASSCQGLGASVWWPNKDHMYDEVDSMKISVNVPKGLTNVSNGRLLEIEEKKNSNTFHWFVNNPINNYGVNINIGDYVRFSEVYDGENGNLDLDYFVLSYNLAKAKEQFKQVPMMIEAFEHWFGPYPFYEDSFKMVEAPYLGMEHQSSITYGNGYTNGYKGSSYPSNSKWGLKFDYIIIHEGGHEWFANNITYRDIADMWIHEGFTTYSENLYVEYFYGKEAGAEYVISSRKGISNFKPIITGEYGVNRESSGDIYAKGANVLHTLRQLTKDDELWRDTLRGINKDFFHQTVSSNQIENYISKKLNINLKKFFDQYLRDTRIPIFEYEINDGELKYRWSNVINGFNMPIEINLDNKSIKLFPVMDWKHLKTIEGNLEINKNYYVKSNKIFN